VRVVALVDGEHHPPVTRWALQSARAAGYDVVAALVVGGGEKWTPGRSFGADIAVTDARADPAGALSRSIDDLRPQGVLDLSDEPVLGYRERFGLAAVALAKGVTYLGPDFHLDPPIVEPPLPVPTLAVIGSGKRVAKTAVGGHVGRLAHEAGLRPTIVAMGRGGPPEPEVVEPGDVTLPALLSRSDRGHHAASDFLEDALVAGVPAVGARRAGGGLAGRPFATTVGAAARLAAERGAGLVILEGSGASMPTVPWDAGILVVPEGVPDEYLAGYLGPLRVLLSDVVVLIIGGASSPGRARLSILESQVHRVRHDTRVVSASLQPVPLGDVRDRTVFFTTTARPQVAADLARQLADREECRVVGTSSALADRALLADELRAAPPFEVLLTELKAGAIDVAARAAVARGAEVVFLANRPVSLPGEALDETLLDAARLAVARGGERTSAEARP
jgi:cyclic 2,3-diphosphoglycerate synthetase